MSDRTKIEWTDATWRPPVAFAPERWDQPLRWKKPRRVFVSTPDIFHESVSGEWIAQMFAVVALASQHTFQVLTRRHERMRSLLSGQEKFPGCSGKMTFEHMVRNAYHNRRNALRLGSAPLAEDVPWPLPNVWLGVTVEDQKHADLRIPALLDTPAAVRWVSCEPLLGPVKLCNCYPGGVTYSNYEGPQEHCQIHGRTRLDWVVVGGESGKDARPMHPDWARSLRDHCTGSYGVPFFFKQWGEWAEVAEGQPGDWWFLSGDGWDEAIASAKANGWPDPRLYEWQTDAQRGAEAGRWGPYRDVLLRRVGKKAAGRELDGRTWDEYPEAAS